MNKQETRAIIIGEQQPASQSYDNNSKRTCTNATKSYCTTPSISESPTDEYHSTMIAINKEITYAAVIDSPKRKEAGQKARHAVAHAVEFHIAIASGTMEALEKQSKSTCASVANSQCNPSSPNAIRIKKW
eukprot:7359841-Ditylum_brightwellii.AAC.1